MSGWDQISDSFRWNIHAICKLNLIIAKKNTTHSNYHLTLTKWNVFVKWPWISLKKILLPYAFSFQSPSNRYYISEFYLTEALEALNIEDHAKGRVKRAAFNPEEKRIAGVRYLTQKKNNLTYLHLEKKLGIGWPAF